MIRWNIGIYCRYFRCGGEERDTERDKRHLKHLLVNLFQGIDSLFELGVVRWKLCLGSSVYR